MASHHSQRPALSSVILGKIGRFIWRWTRRLLKIWAVFTVALLMSLALIQLTSFGRKWVLDIALRETNKMIPGTILAARLDQFSLFGIDISGVRVLDPKEYQVLTLKHVVVKTDLSKILLGRLTLARLQISGGEVDLRAEGDNRGLLAAFLDPAAPKKEEVAGPPPNIYVDRVLVDDVHLLFPPSPTWGAVGVQVTRVRSDFQFVDAEPAFALEELNARATRGAQQLLSLTLEAQVERGFTPSKLRLRAESFGMTAALDAQGILPTQPGWQAEHGTFSFDLQGVSGSRLEELTQKPELKEAFQGEVGFTVEAEGPPLGPQLKGALSTMAGSIELLEANVTKEGLGATIETTHFQLQKWRSSLPALDVGGRLRLQTKGLLPQPDEFRAELSQATLNGQSLPAVNLSGRIMQAGLEDIDLEILQGSSRVAAQGKLGFDGSGTLKMKLDIRPPAVRSIGSVLKRKVEGRLQGNAELTRSKEGNLITSARLNVDHLEAEGITVDSIETTLFLQGQLPHLTGKVLATADGVQAEGGYVDTMQLEANGRASAFELKLSAAGGSGKAPAKEEKNSKKLSKIQLGFHVARGAASTELSGTLTGNVEGRPVELSLDETIVSDSGDLQTQGITIAVGGEEVSVVGAWGPSKVLPGQGLRLRAGKLHLDAITKILHLKQQMVGTVQMEALLWGSFKEPAFDLRLQGQKLGLQGRPTADLIVNSAGNASLGTFHLDSKVTSGQDLRLGLDADAKFIGGAHFVDHLASTEVIAHLNVEHLHTRLFDAFLPKGPLPIGAAISAQWVAGGSFAAPTVKTETDVVVEGAKRDAVIRHVLSYGAGRLQTSVDVSDELGPWAQVIATMELPTLPLNAAALPDALKQGAQSARWSIQGETKKRDLQDVPLMGLVLGSSPAPMVAFALDLEGLHEAHQEPEARLRLEVQQSQVVELASCKSDGAELVAIATHRGTKNKLNVTARSGKKELLHLHAQTDLSFNSLLAGKTGISGPLSLKLQTESLNLEKLPFVCGRAKGEVSLQAVANDILGIDPDLHLQLSGRGLSLGARERLDLDALVDADQSEIRSHLVLRGTEKFKNANGSLQAVLPWHWSEGKVEFPEELPLDAELQIHHLPIAPLLPPKGAISYATGTIHGKVQAGGTLRAPSLQGELVLEEIAFTSTGLAQPLRGIQGRLGFAGRKLSIEKIEAHDRDGVLTLDGTVDLSHMNEVKGDIKIVAVDFPLRQEGQVVAITNLKARAQSTVTPESTIAHLHLTDVDTWLENAELRSGIALTAHEDFHIDQVAPPKKRESQKEASLAAGASKGGVAPRRVHITLDAADNFWIKRDDFAVKLAAFLETDVVGDDVRVEGDVKIDRGYLLLFGKAFDLERGSKLSFIRSSPPNPVLQIEAHNTTREGQLVGVRISGRGDAPIVEFLVDGEVVDASIAVLALMGESDSAGEESAASQAQSFVSGLTAGVLATAARRELGAAAPIVMIEPSDTAGEGRIRAGFELDEIVPAFLRPLITGVYLEGVVARESEGGTRAESNFGALLELYFPHNLYTAGQYGPGTTWSLDFGWQL